MTLPVVFTANGPSGYNLTNSLRFRSSASAYLNRTPASAGNRRTFTYSVWLKRGVLDASYNKYFFSARPSSSVRDGMYFGTNQTLSVFANDGSSALLTTTQVFRDVSAWYHIVVAVDTTQATSSNRVKIYVNGSQVTAFGTATYPTQNYDWAFNNSVIHTISDDAANVPTGLYHFDGYMAEINSIDGQALTPSSFGETSATTGVWQPKKYTGTYGTNGFYLPFTDNSALTTSSNAGLGKDFSGNANYWTTNNISITSGSTYDSMTDVPTLTSATAANYCVLNPLTNVGIGTVSNGNLQLVTSTNSRTMTGTMALPSTGQYYFEITATDYITGGGTTLGIVNEAFIPTTLSNGTWLGFSTYSASYQNGTTTDTNNLTGTDVTQDGDIWCIAIDVTNNKFWIGRSRSGTLVWADGVTPAVNGSGATTISLPTGTLYPMVSRGGSFNETYNFNFGQQPFAHTPPTGFVRLNTFNLPTPTIGATASTTANKYMNIALYTGTGSSQSITGLGFQPDWTWIKGRSGATDHGIYDAVRGVQKQIESNNTDAETTETTGLTAFGSDGFTVGALAQLNTSSATYVGWNWKANGAGSSNTDGTITSTVSVNTSVGFSIVTYTGNGSSTATVGHGLGVEPAMLIQFERGGGDWWHVWHKGLSGSSYNLFLNNTEAERASINDGQIKNNGSSTFAFASTTSNVDAVNENAKNYVVYCFSEVAGYSAFGSYTGNGSSDGPFIFTGFRPRFLMIKRTDTTNNWVIQDTSRDTYNVSEKDLYADTSGAEATYAAEKTDILSNGFKQRQTGASMNASGGTYIYMAFAENPFKYANAR